MAMVAVGGSIGTGLLLGSAAAMEIAGPAVILSFLLAGFITWTVTMALGNSPACIPRPDRLEFTPTSISTRGRGSSHAPATGLGHSRFRWARIWSPSAPI